MYLQKKQKITTDFVSHVRVGSYYEIDRFNLSRRTLDQLKKTKIVMVSKKTPYYVSLRFPSAESLDSYFNVKNRKKPEGNKILPVLDEKHDMGPELAGVVLYRRIAPHEISLKRKLWSFWVVNPPDIEEFKPKTVIPTLNTRLRSVTAKQGCWSVMESPDMVKWGKRRHRSHSEDEENSKETGDEEDGNTVETEVSRDDKKSCGSAKRKNCGKTKESIRTEKRLKQDDQAKEEKNNQIIVYKRKKGAKKFIDRWSLERYKMAEKNMLKVMKENNAVFGNPIMRPELRFEARKWIGDTGLLDHLLKHMSGKVAPGGKDRFRRKHNTEGAMEYWLESADLMAIRTAAGVEDIYWTPPPGWKLGDNPTQDPLCAKGLRELKEYIRELKEDNRELKEDIATLKRQIAEVTSKKQEEELAIVTTPSSGIASKSSDHMSLTSSKKEKTYTDLLTKKTKNEQLLHGIEEAMIKVNSAVEEADPNRRVLLLKESPSTAATALTLSSSNEHAENKAAKIERLKSAFHICNPQRSFMWPDMAAMSPPHHQLNLNPTPPSVSSSAMPLSHYPATSTVKPFAERRPIIVTSLTNEGHNSNNIDKSVSPVSYERRHHIFTTLVAENIEGVEN